LVKAVMRECYSQPFAPLNANVTHWMAIVNESTRTPAESRSDIGFARHGVAMQPHTWANERSHKSLATVILSAFS